MTEPLSISSNTSWTAYKLHDGFDAKILIVCVSLWLIKQRFPENPQDIQMSSQNWNRQQLPNTVCMVA